MTDVLHDALSSVTATEPATAGPLQVFGLRWTSPAHLDYVTLPEALEEGLLQITEVNEAGNVPNLKVVNGGDHEVLLLAGELVIGAKQNRAINASMMVPAKSEVVVPVSCIEQGRWGYRSRTFLSSDETAHGSLKAHLHRQVHASYRATRRPSTDQRAVWAEVQRKLDTTTTNSDTADLHQMHREYRRVLDDMLGSVRLPDDCAGAAFVFGGRVVGVELFDRPAILQRALPKLARAYALDALEYEAHTDGEEGKRSTWLRRLRSLFPMEGAAAAVVDPEADGRPLGAEDVADWVRLARQVPVERFPSPGMGDDLRLESDTHIGACLLVEETPVHTELFSEVS